MFFKTCFVSRYSEMNVSEGERADASDSSEAAETGKWVRKKN